MRNYLSFGGGVNSVAMMLMLLDQGVDFEAVFVNHGTDWPETYDYVAVFQWWLQKWGLPPITILRPDVEGFNNLYRYCEHKQIIPNLWRWCTDKFKLRPVYKYVDAPCFMFIGFSVDEAHRAKINHKKGVENRYPLIENDIDRDGCKQIIIDHKLPVPPKSGCYICPFNKVGDFKRLRVEHPDLFCNARGLEAAAQKAHPDNNVNLKGGKKLDWIVDEHQSKLWEEDEYPPCQCGL